MRLHVLDLMRRGQAGDTDAVKSLGCMVLLIEGFPEDEDDGGKYIPTSPYVSMAAH